jgi:hypothetical protein
MSHNAVGNIDGEVVTGPRMRRRLLSIWVVDQQWSNKHESPRGIGRRTAIVAHGTRSYRPNRSGMNKIVRSTSATLCGIRRSNVRAQTAIFAAILHGTHGGAQPGFAQAAISECAHAFCHAGADALKARRPAFSLDSANGSANERNSKIDGDASTRQMSLRRAAPILRRRHRSYQSSASSSVEIDRLLCIALEAPFGHEMENA